MFLIQVFIEANGPWLTKCEKKSEKKSKRSDKNLCEQYQLIICTMHLF